MVTPASHDVVFAATMKRSHILAGLFIGVLMALFGGPALFYWDKFSHVGARILGVVVGLLGTGLTGSSVEALFRVGAPVFTIRFEPTCVCWGHPGARLTSIVYGEISAFSTDFFDVTRASILFTLSDGRRVVLESCGFSGRQLEQIRAVLESRSGQRDRSPR